MMPSLAEKIWQEGIAPLLNHDQLLALRMALASNNPRLTQGSTTTTPPPLQCVLDWPCEGACVVGYAGWQGDGLETVGEVEEYFARLCFEADSRLGEPAAVRYFLNWFDNAPREEVFADLLKEVDLALSVYTH